MPDIIQLVKTNCRDCHCCIRYCPTKAIRYSGHQANIIGNMCVLCGECYRVCPHDAKSIVDGKEITKVLIQQSEGPVIASIDPAFPAFFGVGLSSITEGLKAIGFTGVEETAIGAAIVKKHYDLLISESDDDVIISTTCPSVVSLVEKYYPELIPYLAPVVSPMVAHAQDIKRRMPDAKIVHIGGCIARKQEQFDTEVDAMLTFDELEEIFQLENITLAPQTDPPLENSKERRFCLPGGMLSCLNTPEDPSFSMLEFDGVDMCRHALDDIRKGSIHKCFVELNMCNGGCVGSPIMEHYRNEPVRGSYIIRASAGSKSFEVPEVHHGENFRAFQSRTPRMKNPLESEIREILKSIGRDSPEKELNCGTCGYPTCRDKAIAIYRGIADPNMCLPHIMAQTRSFQSNILDNTPNGVIILNDDFEIQVINPKAMELMNIRHESDVLGENVVRILDPTPFFTLYSSGQRLSTEKRYFSDYRKYCVQTIINDTSSRTMMCILRDVTEEEEARLERERIGKDTIEIADKIVDKQMRIVQDIAMLLGETTAETKIALTKLKERIDINENE